MLHSCKLAFQVHGPAVLTNQIWIIKTQSEKNENIFEHLKKKQMIVILNVKMFVSKQYDNELSKHISQWLSFIIYCNFTIWAH